ncbi:MAG TPA: hypothetical protein VF516_07655, partial [Kofleriaceae bacterium]
ASPGYPSPGYPPPGYPPPGYPMPAAPGYPMPAPPGYPPPFGAGAMGQPQAGFDALGALWQALRQGQIPPLPGQLPGGMGAGQLAPPPRATMPGARPPADATALLGMFLGGLPQLSGALRSAAVLGPDGPRTMALSIPAAGAPGGVRNVQIPLGAVMNTLASLASRSMEELNASTQESDPEIPDYLVDEEGRFLVDPASAAARAGLVTHIVRVHQAAHRAGWFAEAEEGLDEAEAWARDAGFERWE